MSEILYVKDTFVEYLSKNDCVTISDVKTFIKSPRLYFYEKNKSQNEFLSGNLSIPFILHEYLMNNDFFNLYSVEPKIDKRTKSGKLELEKHLEKSTGKTIIPFDEMEIIKQMAIYAKTNNAFLELFLKSYYETSCYETDLSTGLKIKFRPGIINTKSKTIIDINLCVNSSLEKFKKDIFINEFDVDAAMYHDFLEATEVIFIQTEKSPPFQTSLYALDDEIIEQGRNKYRMALDLLQWSKENEYWCDYSEFEILKQLYILGDLTDALNMITNINLVQKVTKK